LVAHLITALLVVFASAGTVVHAQSQSVPTFSRDIAPILREHCVACHRPEGAAPFSLATFADARARASVMVRATSARFMPPWKPQPGHGDFAEARHLTDQQIAVIKRWAESGAPEGEPLERPIVSASGDAWEFGAPDLVVTMPEAYTVAAEGADVIRSFVIPVAGARGRFVRALEFHAGNARVVHHANIKVDATGSSRRLDAEDAGPGFAGSSATQNFRTAIFWAGRPASGRTRRRETPGISPLAPTSSSNCT